MRVKMSKQPPPAPTASAVGPCPTLIQTSRSVDWLIKSSNQWFFGGGRGEGSRVGLQGKKRVGQGLVGWFWI